jgi:hypothetical protein
MDLYFSEFSYGYAVTHEYEQFYAFPLKPAPIFPSLQDEGTKGYDVDFCGAAYSPARLAYHCFCSRAGFPPDFGAGPQCQRFARHTSARACDGDVTKPFPLERRHFP